MDHLNNEFTRYALSPEEEEMGRVLSSLQIGVLQNLRADTIIQLAHLQPSLDVSFIQQHAKLSGKLELLNELLTPKES